MEKDNKNTEPESEDIKLSTIDPKIVAVLGSDEVTDQVLAIADEMGFVNTQIAKFSESILFLFQKKISLENYPYLLQNELRINEADALKTSTYVGKMFLVPYSKSFFPEGQKYFDKWLHEAKSKGADFSKKSQAGARAFGAKEEPKREKTTSEPTFEKESESSDISSKEALGQSQPAESTTKKKVSPPGITADIRPVRKKTKPPVSQQTKKTGPDSLKLVSLDDLEGISPRVLDKEPPDAGKLIDRLKEEIQNIANQSGAKRPEIIDSWKKSQLYETYVDMGNDSMQAGKSIPEITAVRKAEGKPYLTESQFHAVSDISRLLLS